MQLWSFMYACSGRFRYGCSWRTLAAGGYEVCFIVYDSAPVLRHVLLPALLPRHFGVSTTLTKTGLKRGVFRRMRVSSSDGTRCRTRHGRVRRPLWLETIAPNNPPY